MVSITADKGHNSPNPIYYKYIQYIDYILNTYTIGMQA